MAYTSLFAQPTNTAKTPTTSGYKPLFFGQTETAKPTETPTAKYDETPESYVSPGE